ncbi:MAG: lysoplasmalogenase [Chloroflexota bacterium]
MKWLILPLLVAASDWLSVSRSWEKIGYVTKPATVLTLIGWMFAQGVVQLPLGWFAIGLGFSLLGDVLLMLPQEQFIGGVIAFLLAHLMYILGLNAVPPLMNVATLVVVVVVVLTAARLGRSITRNLSSTQKAAIISYIVVVSLMLISALMTLTCTGWRPGPAILVSIGGLLFFVSDALLAWNRFVEPINQGKLKVRVTYHLGQIALISGAAAQMLGLSTSLG